jgi:hypothetical protein
VAVAALCSVLIAASAAAQQVLAPPPIDYSQKALVAPPPDNTNQVGTTTTESAPSAVAAPPSNEGLLGWARVHLHPHLLYRLSYGDGIQASVGNQSKTLINEIDPGMSFELGRHWHLDYTPTLRYYSSSAFRDELNHSVSLSGGTTYEDWIFGLSQTYSSSSSPLVETGSQTDTESYSTSLNAAYQINSKVSVDAAVAQNFSFVGQSANTNELTDTRTWTATAGLNYQLWPRVSVGASASVGYDDVNAGSDMMSESLQGRINWRAGTKLSLAFSGGFERREYLSSNVSPSLDPVFSLSLVYRLFDQTTISLTASRTVSASYFASETSDNTALSAGIQQRLFEKFALSVNVGYGTTTYQGTSTGVSSGRHDDHSSVDVRLSHALLRRATISIYYDWSDNGSNDSGYKYTSNQTGVEVGYHF